MKPLTLLILGLAIYTGYWLGVRHEVRTHQAYIQSLNLGGK